MVKDTTLYINYSLLSLVYQVQNLKSSQSNLQFPTLLIVVKNVIFVRCLLHAEVLYEKNIHSIIYSHLKLCCLSNIQDGLWINSNCFFIRKSYAPRTHPGYFTSKNIRNRVKPNLGYSLFVQAIIFKNIQRNITT